MHLERRKELRKEKKMIRERRANRGKSNSWISMKMRTLPGGSRDELPKEMRGEFSIVSESNFPTCIGPNRTKMQVCEILMQISSFYWHELKIRIRILQVFSNTSLADQSKVPKSKSANAYNSRTSEILIF